MPELPEAETIVRGLRQTVPGRAVVRVEVLHADVLRERPDSFRSRIEGRTVEGVDRRGKNVVVRLSEGLRLMVNLGMTGRLLPVATGAEAPQASHPAVILHFEDGGALVYDDTRRFGSAEALGPAEWEARDRALGIEPLSGDFTLRHLEGLLEASRSPVRSWLLDQRRVVGIGNIYAAEALFRAGIHPRRPARSLGTDEVRELHRGIREVLEEAVEARGTTLRDYRTAEGDRGGFAGALAVYGREGEPCPCCGTPVERDVFSNRSAFFCPGCQPA